MASAECERWPEERMEAVRTLPPPPAAEWSWCRTRRVPRQPQELEMLDVIYVLLVIGLFVTVALLSKGVERL